MIIFLDDNLFSHFFASVESLQRKQHSMSSINHYKHTATTWRCFLPQIKISPGKSWINGKVSLKTDFANCFSCSSHPEIPTYSPNNSTRSCGRYQKSFIVLQARRFAESVRNIPRKHLSIVPERSFRDAEDSSDEWNTTDALGCKSGSELEVIELASADPSIVKRGITKTRLYNPSACVDWHWS
jgi:hypothetical protein